MLQKKKQTIQRDILMSEVPELRYEIDRLNEELALKDAEIEHGMADRWILKELFNKGIIDEEGNPFK